MYMWERKRIIQQVPKSHIFIWNVSEAKKIRQLKHSQFGILPNVTFDILLYPCIMVQITSDKGLK